VPPAMLVKFEVIDSDIDGIGIKEISFDFKGKKVLID
jgi:hypothetical protein